MGWSQINKVGVSSVAGQDITSAAVDMAGADTLFAFVADFGGAAASVFSDSNTNNWTPLTEQVVASFIRGRWLYAKNATCTSMTFSCATGGINKYPSFRVYGYSGGNLATPLDAENGATNAGAGSIACGSVSPDSDNELILAGVAFGDIRTYTIDSGFSAVDEQNFVGGAAFGSAAATLLQGSAAAVNPTWSNGSSDSMAAVIGTFRPNIRRWILGPH